jgi:hypothetical protein
MFNSKKNVLPNQARRLRSNRRLTDEKLAEIRLVLGGQTVPPGVLSSPELAESFCRVVQPIMIREQGDQFSARQIEAASLS